MLNEWNIDDQEWKKIIISLLKKIINNGSVEINKLPILLKKLSNESSIQIKKNGKRRNINNYIKNKYGNLDTLLIELNHIWIKDKKCGASWDVHQIKYYPNLISLDDCFILSDDESDDECKVKRNGFKTVYKCLSCSSEFHTNSTQNFSNSNSSYSRPSISNSMLQAINLSKPPPPPPVKKTSSTNQGTSFRPPSVKDLLNMRNKLKKAIIEEN